MKNRKNTIPQALITSREKEIKEEPIHKNGTIRNQTEK